MKRGTATGATDGYPVSGRRIVRVVMREIVGRMGFFVLWGGGARGRGRELLRGLGGVFGN